MIAAMFRLRTNWMFLWGVSVTFAIDCKAEGRFSGRVFRQIIPVLALLGRSPILLLIMRRRVTFLIG